MSPPCIERFYIVAAYDDPWREQALGLATTFPRRHQPTIVQKLSEIPLLESQPPGGLCIFLHTSRLEEKELLFRTYDHNLWIFVSGGNVELPPEILAKPKLKHLAISGTAYLTASMSLWLDLWNGSDRTEATFLASGKVLQDGTTDTAQLCNPISLYIHSCKIPLDVFLNTPSQHSTQIFQWLKTTLSQSQDPALLAKIDSSICELSKRHKAKTLIPQLTDSTASRFFDSFNTSSQGNTSLPHRLVELANRETAETELPVTCHRQLAHGVAVINWLIHGPRLSAELWRIRHDVSNLLAAALTVAETILEGGLDDELRTGFLNVAHLLENPIGKARQLLTANRNILPDTDSELWDTNAQTELEIQTTLAKARTNLNSTEALQELVKSLRANGESWCRVFGAIYPYRRKQQT